MLNRPPFNFFPVGVCAAYSDGSETPPALPAEEAVAVANAVESRRREFALGRWCARRALAELGVQPQAIPVGNDRGPRWPQGIVGSITHCKGFVGAVVAPTHALHAIGFDAERADPLALDLIPSVCTTREIAWVESQPIAPSIDWPKVIFSAKEALHKCVSPSSGRMLDFRDVTLLIDPDRLTFEATAAAPGSADGVDLSRVRGRIAPGERFVFTYATINNGT